MIWASKLFDEIFFTFWSKKGLVVKKKCTFYLRVKVFSTKVLIGDTILTSPNGDGTAILRGHPSHAKVSPLAVQRKYLHFSVILRPWVMVRPRDSNPRPPVLQSNALPTELILPRLKSEKFKTPKFTPGLLKSKKRIGLSWWFGGLNKYSSTS